MTWDRDALSCIRPNALIAPELSPAYEAARGGPMKPGLKFLNKWPAAHVAPSRMTMTVK
jgi:hypothetical protein